MAYRQTRLGLLIALGQHQTAKRVIREALRNADGSVNGAAEILGVDRSTLRRWIHKLRLRRDVNQMKSVRSNSPTKVLRLAEKLRRK